MSLVRRILWMLLVILLIAPHAAATAAAAQTSSTTPPIDLAAMTLTPADLASIGLFGFGNNSSSERDFETERAIISRDKQDSDRAAFEEAFAKTGFLRRSTSSLLQPVFPLTFHPDGYAEPRQMIASAVTEYATASGATSAFVLLEDESDQPNAKDLSGVRRFGSQSEITRYEIFSGVLAAPAQRSLNLTVRVGKYIADVSVLDYNGRTPSTELVENLGDLLLAKITAVQRAGEPGLSTQVLRLSPISDQIEFGLTLDGYTTLNGQTPPTYTDVVSALGWAASYEEASTSWLNANVDQSLVPQPATYQVLSYFHDGSWTESPSQEELASLAYTYITLYDKVTVSDAIAEVASLRGVFDTDGSNGGYQLDPTARPFGDESFAGFQRSDGRVNYAIVARVGTKISYIFVSATDSMVVAPTVEAMTSAQIACLNQPSLHCAPFPMPAALLTES